MIAGISSTLVFIILILFSFAISRFFSRFVEQFTFIKNLTFSLLGISLGAPLGFAVLTSEMLTSANLLIYFILGMISFNTGLKLKSSHFKDDYWGPSFCTAFVQVILISSFFVLIGYIYILAELNHSLNNFISFVHTKEFSEVIIFSLAMGSFSLFNSGPTHFFKRSDLREDAPVFELISQISAALQSGGILLFSLLIFILNILLSSEQMTLNLIIIKLLTVFLPIILALLFIAFVGKEINEEKLFLATLGGILFSSGIGMEIGHSIFLFPFLVGIIVGKYLHETKQLEKTLVSLEDPANIFIIMIASAHLTRINLTIIGLSLFYVLLRLFYNLSLSNYFTKEIIKKRYYGLSMAGRGVIAQNAFPVGAALFLQGSLPLWGNDILLLVLLSTIANEYLGAIHARGLMIDCDELIQLNQLPQLSIELKSKQEMVKN